MRSAGAYLRAADAIYDRRPLTDLLRFLGPPRATAAASPDLFRDGLVTIGQRSDPAFSYDFGMVGKLAGGLKLKTEDAAPSEDGLRAAITKLKDANKTDIAIFLGGHGFAPVGKGFSYKNQHGETIADPESRVPQVTLEQRSNSAITLSPGALKTTFGAFPSLNFKLIIDSCYSGRFQAALKGHPQSGHHAHLHRC